MVYDQPPPYEFQTVAMNFDHDDKVDGGQVEPSETPVFVDDNKVNKKRGRVPMRSNSEIALIDLISQYII